MTGVTEHGTGRRSRRWRLALWGAAAGLWLLPLLAMQFTTEVAWGPRDFAVFGAMLAAACGSFELAARASGDRTYLAAVAIALATAFMLVWANLAVGIIGSEDEPANLLYHGVPAVGIVGALLARFRPRGMARALLATAVAQTLVALFAGTPQTLALTAPFIILWLASAGLFRRAARNTAGITS
ncbi:hypothetical protein [Rehaibacterium terrae]|uniref:Uncharacterized protein n=1 Tax=Rehaibacterium terrae TaxID=1341696 RepID=A0A7W8DD89_9GAMM|nr:hypothetical protein [Rehaibacterium terrae]MBB5014779.1 hypothetical protein [Rehaibacterium terrae]